MDMTTIAAAYEALRFAKDALKLSLDYKVEIDAREKVRAALEKLGDVQDSLFGLREELARLQSENGQFRQELKVKNEWEIQKCDYKLEETPGGAIVYAFSGVPKHFACPSCFSKSVIQILQDRRVMTGHFDCPGCKAAFPVEKYKDNTIMFTERNRSNDFF